MSQFYTGRQALTIATIFMLLDISVNWLVLMWNGKNFSMDNIYQWFDWKKYKFTVNPVDFMAIAFLRDCLLVGGAIGVWASPSKGRQATRKLRHAVFAFMLIVLAFSPSKLLAFYEDPDIKLAIVDWILMIWCMMASIFVQIIWSNVLTRVRDSFSEDGTEPLFGNQEAEARSRYEEQKRLAQAQQQRDALKLLFRLFGYMGREWKYYTAAFAFLFLYSLCRVFIPYYAGEVVTAVFADQPSYERLYNVVLIMSVLSFFCTLFGGLRGGAFTYSQARIDRQLRNDLFRSIVKQEIGFFDINETGEICSRLNTDCPTVSNTLSHYMNVLIGNVTMLVGCVIFMFALSWNLSMITIISVPITFLLSKAFGVYYDKLSEDVLTATARANEAAEEAVSGISTVKSFACENFERKRFLGFLDKTLAIGVKRAFAVIGFTWSSDLLQMGILTAVLWYGGHLVLQEKVEPGLLVSFIVYQLELGSDVRELGEVWNELMQAVGASRKVFEFIDREPEFSCSAGDQQPPNMKGRIEFRNVAFSYPTRPDLPIMEDLSFIVEPGEVLAIVGPSGGGKSSCIALLQHLYEPVKGEVLIDGINVCDYEQEYLHTKVALVGQEPILYARSVYENIGYGMDDITEAMVHNCGRLANAHEFLTDMSEGYKTDVGEKGTQMSGGQKQQIAIARALIRDPVVLLLDEATCALDTESEHLVQEAISKHLKGKTVVIIANRLSTVERADKIIVINKGRVEEIGTHQQLLAKDGIYKQLVQSQIL